MSQLDKQTVLEAKFQQKIDQLNRPISIGDYVIYCKGGGKSSAVMGLGQVYKWSEQQVQIYPCDMKTFEANQDYSRSVAMHKIMVITDQIKANKELFPELFI